MTLKNNILPAVAMTFWIVYCLLYYRERQQRDTMVRISENSIKAAIQDSPVLTRSPPDQQTVKKLMYVNPHPDVKPKDNFAHCEYNACELTTSESDADVLLFNAGRMKGLQLKPRRANQIWVMYSKEPPDLPRFDNVDRPDLHHQVNYSRMILSDSTWQNKYGGLKERPLPKRDFREIYRQKRYNVAWFVSRCSRPSQRMEYVKRMMRSVDVHIYGRCGNYSCGASGYTMGGSKSECTKLLSRDYKFYLAFENTFCRDYVSEKFFNLFDDVDVIPVVRGGADYRSLFPANVYIDASDFSSPEELGTYLHNLAQDEGKYVQMLERKSRYMRSGYETNFTCDLCKRAHTGQPKHVYDDFYRWLRSPGNCWRPTDLN